ncbi:hypothetical protein LIY46_02580 [Fusobacterium varium]
MTPKERVRANIYKTLLEEEKRKNKEKGSIFAVFICIRNFYKFYLSNAFQGSSYDWCRISM